MCVRVKGCCGLSLRRTCLIIGIVYLVYNIILFINSSLGGGSQYVFSANRHLRLSPGAVTITFLTFSMFTILLCVFLILAATFENKYLIIPWFFGYALAIAQFIVAFTLFIMDSSSSKYDDDDDDDSFYTPNESKRKPERHYYNETRSHGRYETYSINHFWSVFESVLKFVIETILLNYAASYFIELWKSNSETRSSNRRRNS